MIADIVFKIYRLAFVVPAAITMHRLRNNLLSGVSADEMIPLVHPIDRQYGIDTSGVIGYRELRSGKSADKYNICYGGSQPSIIRKALATLSDHQALTFCDFGCGKGRALAVASEFSFRRIIGVELAPSLASIARSNADIIRSRFPDRTPIEVVEGDVLAAPFPEGPVVVYFYHPFYRAMMKKVLNRIENWSRQSEKGGISIIYYNPVYFDLFDRSREFSRVFAQNIEFEPNERGTGPNYHDDSDAIAIWQNVVKAPIPSISRSSYATIKVEPPGWRALVVK